MYKAGYWILISQHLDRTWVSYPISSYVTNQLLRVFSFFCKRIFGNSNCTYYINKPHFTFISLLFISGLGIIWQMHFQR